MTAPEFQRLLRRLGVVLILTGRQGPHPLRGCYGDRWALVPHHGRVGVGLQRKIVKRLGVAHDAG
jgi:hypothetical protein